MKGETGSGRHGRPCRLFAGAALRHPEALSKGHVHAVTGEWVGIGAVWEEVACMCKCASAVEKVEEGGWGTGWVGGGRPGNESDELMAICPHACP